MPSKIDNRLPPQVINYRHVKFIHDDAESIEKENRLILERLTLINQRIQTSEKCGLDYKKVHRRLNVRYKKEHNRRIAVENAALIKRILNTPVTVPSRNDCNKQWKHLQKVRKCHLRYNKGRSSFGTGKGSRMSTMRQSLPPINGLDGI
jgi:hypothetical protein